MKRLVAPVLLAVSFGVHAESIENHLPRISAVPAVPSVGQPFSLLVKGQWPDGCGAAVRNIAVKGFDITVVMARPPIEICTQQIVDYELPLNPFADGTSPSAGTYRVRYELAIPGESKNRLLAFTLVPVVPTGGRVVEPEPGYWVAEQGGEFSTSGSGVGFSIERQGSTVVVMSNLYEQSGKPAWYFTAAPAAGATARGELTAVTGGQALFDTYRPPAAMDNQGELLMEFSAPTTGTLWFTQASGGGVIDELKIQPISVARFNFGFSAVNQVFGGRFVYFTEQPSSDANRHLDFVPIRFGAFVLIGFWNEATDERLECRINVDKPNTLPEVCTFNRAGQLVATFDQIGFDSLRGVDVQGRRVIMQRL